MPSGVYQHKPMAQRFERVCRTCGKVRLFTASQLRHQSGNYCSAKCAHPPMPVPPVKCAICGADFWPQHRRQLGPRYCSRRCAGLSRRASAPKWEDPEYRRAYFRDYVAKNRDHLRELARRNVAEKPEVYRAIKKKWAFKNREKLAAKDARRQRVNSTSRAATGEQIQGLYRKSMGYCVYCGAKANKMHIDHVQPIAAGGKSNVRNLIPCCPSCNRSKSTSEASDWLEQKHGVLGLARAVVFLTRQKIDPAFYPAFYPAFGRAQMGREIVIVRGK